MRLLHFDAQNRLILTDFRGKSIPPYAILSHRWTDSETLIEDVSNGNYRQKREGYEKLRFCAKQAAKDGLQYFWIDTCCIDRWDKNERSNAINSMFQWYRKAARCYVFLSDVSVSSATEASQRSSWEASFRGSDWFTRGWTLQELIAPEFVEFFSREGQRIGDKASLNQLLHDRTGIPLTALRNCPLDQFSPSERRRWVENRKTTEEEDIVYCLLGLLGVSMPTTYGEGKESAMRRLQGELEAVGNGAPSLIPFSRNELFVGRESQLARLQATLFSNKLTTTTLAVVGPSGTGKSQLALEAAYRTRLNNNNCSVFWIDASGTDSLYRSYASVAQKLSIPGYDDDQADIKQMVKRCVAEVSTRQCLLVFDNAEGTAVQRSSSSMTQAADLAEFLPRSKLCSIIFTTTESDTAEALALQHVIMLHELTPGTALNMLQNRLTRPLSNAERQGAIYLLRELSHLPLAVSQAAACINAGSITVQQYQAQLDEHRGAALEDGNGLSDGEQRDLGPRKAVAATLSVSMSQILQRNVVAAEYLWFAACVDRKDISLDLLVAASPQAREDAIMILNRYALITRRPAESAFDVHRLVHQALREHLQMQGRLHECTQRAVTQLLQVFPNSDHSNRSKWRRLLPHAQYALSHSENNNNNNNNNEERINLAEDCARALQSDGQYKRAEELYMQVIESRRRVLGRKHPHTLTSVSDFGLVLSSQGKYEEAEMIHRRALKAREKVLGREHPDTLTSVSNLGSVLLRQGRYEEAEVMHRRALEAREKVLGREHPDTLTSGSNLGLVLSSQSRYEEAEVIYRRALEGSEKMLGCEYPDTLTSASNLGLVLSSQGKYEEAEMMHRQALEGFKKVLGREHPNTLTSASNLGLVLSSQGKYEEAQMMHRQALEAREKVLGCEHPDTLTSIGNLGSVLERQGKYEEAEMMHRRALEGFKKVLRREHPNTLISVSNLGSVLERQGRYEEAEVIHRRALEAREKVLGREHPDTLTSVSKLGSVLSRQNKYEEAEVIHRQALEGFEKVLRSEHPNTLASVSNLGLALERQGRYEEAEIMYRRALEGYEKVLGREHPNTLTSISNLGSVLSSQGKYEEAETMHRRALDGYEKVLGREHPNTLTSVYCLGHLLATLCDYKESLDLYSRACDGYSVVLGKHHPTTRACRQYRSEMLLSYEQSRLASSRRGG